MLALASGQKSLRRAQDALFRQKLPGGHDWRHKRRGHQGQPGQRPLVTAGGVGTARRRQGDVRKRDKQDKRCGAAASADFKVLPTDDSRAGGAERGPPWIPPKHRSALCSPRQEACGGGAGGTQQRSDGPTADALPALGWVPHTDPQATRPMFPGHSWAPWPCSVHSPMPGTPLDSQRSRGRTMRKQQGRGTELFPGTSPITTAFLFHSKIQRHQMTRCDMR